MNLAIAALVKKPLLENILSVCVRLLLSAIFILSGVSKIFAYAATAGYMESQGVPGGLLPLVILVELGAGVAVLIGFQTRLFALILAGFSVVSALLFHSGSDQVSQIMLMKNLSMAGGFLALVLFGGGKFSVDRT